MEELTSVLTEILPEYNLRSLDVRQICPFAGLS